MPPSPPGADDFFKPVDPATLIEAPTGLPDVGVHDATAGRLLPGNDLPGD